MARKGRKGATHSEIDRYLRGDLSDIEELAEDELEYDHLAVTEDVLQDQIAEFEQFLSQFEDTPTRLMKIPMLIARCSAARCPAARR